LRPSAIFFASLERTLAAGAAKATGISMIDAGKQDRQAQRQRRRGMRLESAAATSIIEPAATKTDDRLNSDKSNEQIVGGAS
jgi:hypothetical protein